MEKAITNLFEADNYENLNSICKWSTGSIAFRDTCSQNEVICPDYVHSQVFGIGGASAA